jgi:hypothetical protein
MRKLTPLGLLLLGLAAALPAAAWDVRRDASAGDFRDFARRFASNAYAYPGHPAKALGVTGFEAFAEASYDDTFDEQPFFPGAVDDDLDGGFLSVARVGVRKGLPKNIDLGVSIAEAVGMDLRLATAEVQWAFLDGGAVSPDVALRITATHSQGGDAFTLDQAGVEVLVSKSFPLLTPYVGGGVAVSRARLDRSETLSDLSVTHTQPVAYAGVRLSLLIPKITAEIQRGDTTQYALRVALGF